MRTIPAAIRKLASAIGTKPMTIYRHVASKEDIIDGMVERVFAEIGRPSAGGDWLGALRQRCVSARVGEFVAAVEGIAAAFDAAAYPTLLVSSASTYFSPDMTSATRLSLVSMPSSMR